MMGSFFTLLGSDFGSGLTSGFEIIPVSRSFWNNDPMSNGAAVPTTRRN
jgi:hypothetical protein